MNANLHSRICIKTALLFSTITWNQTKHSCMHGCAMLTSWTQIMYPRNCLLFSVSKSCMQWRLTVLTVLAQCLRPLTIAWKMRAAKLTVIEIQQTILRFRKWHMASGSSMCPRGLVHSCRYSWYMSMCIHGHVHYDCHSHSLWVSSVVQSCVEGAWYVYICIYIYVYICIYVYVIQSHCRTPRTIRTCK